MEVVYLIISQKREIDRTKVSDLSMRWCWFDLLVEFVFDNSTTRAKLVRKCNR
jgi:hypothetical protein